MLTVVAQFTAKMTVYFLSLMFCSVNKLKSHLLCTCTNFMLSNFTWKKNFVPRNGVGGGMGWTNTPYLPTLCMALYQSRRSRKTASINYNDN